MRTDGRGQLNALVPLELIDRVRRKAQELDATNLGKVYPAHVVELAIREYLERNPLPDED